jgi:hypothetical protein
MLTYQTPAGAAFQSRVSLAKYVRNIVHDEIVQRGTGFEDWVKREIHDCTVGLFGYLFSTECSIV